MFNRSTKKEKEKEKESNGPVATHSTLTYPHRLSFYEEPPTHNITLEQFEAWAIDRLRGTSARCTRLCPVPLTRHPSVLAEIEAARIRNVPEGIKNIVNSQCEKYLMLHPNSDATTVDLDAERRKDHVSHFVLRLAFCRTCVFSVVSILFASLDLPARNSARNLSRPKRISSKSVS